MKKFKIILGDIFDFCFEIIIPIIAILLLLICVLILIALPYGIYTKEVEKNKAKPRACKAWVKQTENPKNLTYQEWLDLNKVMRNFKDKDEK